MCSRKIFRNDRNLVCFLGGKKYAAKGKCFFECYKIITILLQKRYEMVTKVLQKNPKWLFFTFKVLFFTFSEFCQKSVVQYTGNQLCRR